MRLVALILAALFAALPVLDLPAFAQTPQVHETEDEAKVKAVIAEWYKRVGRFKADAPWTLMAPGSIDGGPGYSAPVDGDIDGQKAAVIRGPWLNHELASKALKFEYDVDVLKVDARLAKAMVWERGYFYAWANQQTYENAASAMFVFEKMDTGEWKILAHEANSIGIPPNKITNPMPDLRELYYSTIGKGRDPAADAEAAKNF
jgi:hypothetical protein